MLTEALADERALHRLVAWGMILAGVLSVLGLSVMAAPYGRYSTSERKQQQQQQQQRQLLQQQGSGEKRSGSSSGGWGPLVPARIAWITMEAPNLINAAYFILVRGEDLCLRGSIANRLMLGMYLLHYLNRTLVYPFRTRGGKPMPLSVMLMACSFCVVNGYLQVRALTKFHCHDDAEWLGKPQLWLGIAIFLIGITINIHSDTVLLNLRKPGDTAYRIPHGGMFEYVSGANFFGEIVEWTGYAIACGALHGAAFAFFTACNIGPRALQHHEYYLAKFKEEYPKNRKALIPFLL